MQAHYHFVCFTACGLILTTMIATLTESDRTVITESSVASQSQEVAQLENAR